MLRAGVKSHFAFGANHVDCNDLVLNVVDFHLASENRRPCRIRQMIQEDGDRVVHFVSCLGWHMGFNSHPDQRHLVLAV